MAHKKNTTDLTELLLECVTQPDPMLSMLEWLCTQLMEAEVDQQLGAEKSERADSRNGNHGLLSYFYCFIYERNLACA